jgi:predicted GTPase
MAILLKQFEDISLEIVEAVSVLESVQPDTTVTKEFKDRLELARTRLQQKMATLDSNEIGMLDKITRAKEIEMRANHDLEEGA